MYGLGELAGPGPVRGPGRDGQQAGTPCSVGKPGLDPVLDAVGVLADVDVAELLQLGGDLSAVGAGAVGAVGDDRGVLVGQQGGCAGGDVVGDEVHRVGQVLLGVVGLGQRVDEHQTAGVHDET